MIKPLTQQQIAEMKAETESYVAANYPNRQNQTILSLIATLEARDAAFDVMLAALKSTKEGMEDSSEFDAYPEICFAIAQAEKVKWCLNYCRTIPAPTFRARRAV